MFYCFTLVIKHMHVVCSIRLLMQNHEIHTVQSNVPDCQSSLTSNTFRERFTLEQYNMCQPWERPIRQLLRTEPWHECVVVLPEIDNIFNIVYYLYFHPTCTCHVDFMYMEIVDLRSEWGIWLCSKGTVRGWSGSLIFTLITWNNQMARYPAEMDANFGC